VSPSTPSSPFEPSVSSTHHLLAGLGIRFLSTSQNPSRSARFCISPHPCSLPSSVVYLCQPPIFPFDRRHAFKTPRPPPSRRHVPKTPVRTGNPLILRLFRNPRLYPPPRPPYRPRTPLTPRPHRCFRWFFTNLSLASLTKARRRVLSRWMDIYSPPFDPRALLIFCPPIFVPRHLRAPEVCRITRH